jgi:hypothetical protein
LYKKNSLLDSYEKIDAAIYNKTPVLIHQANETLGFGGVIESHSEYSVTINGIKYLKATCEIRIR